MKTANNSNYDTLKRNFEKAFTAGNYTDELMELSTAITYSVLKKCIDPQRKQAEKTGNASNAGYSPAMVALKRDVYSDIRLLDNTRNAANAATYHEYNADGDTVTVITDSNAYAAYDLLIGKALGEGVDLVHTAAVALLEQAAGYANCDNWLDNVYQVTRLSKKVYIQSADSLAYKTVDTTPIQETYRAVRREIQANRALQAEINGYTYIDELTPDGLDTIYHRLGKYADLGGNTVDGLYTADMQALDDYNAIIDKLQLTDRQLTVVNLRMRGYGAAAISTYLGISEGNVYTVLKRIRAKCTAIGFTPDRAKK